MAPGGRGVVFGRSADVYDLVRPSYPQEAFNRLKSMTPMDVVVEIGAGTGIATAGIAAESRRVICVEPDAGMATVLESRGLPGVEVVVSRFEDWEGPNQPADLVLAAQAWHWIDPKTGYRHAREILRAGGMLALIWNVPIDRYKKYSAVYEAHAPELLTEQDERIVRRDSDTWLAELTAAGFEDAQLFTHNWAMRLSSAETRMLYSTFSDHMQLELGRRDSLLDALELHIDDLGGSAVHEYRTQLFTASSPLTS